MSDEIALELTGVSKGYGADRNRIEVLKDINLTVRQGEFVAIVGYSGSGKTTLLSILAGLLKPDSGSVLLHGSPVTSPGPDRGVIFQDYSLLPWLTAAENVALAVDQVFGSWPAAKRREHVARHLALVKLTAAAHKRPHELSGGMRQRVAVARALATDPAVLLMDEPLGALDALTRATLQDEIERIWERDRKTVVLITNDVDEGILLADRIIPLNAGPEATLGPSFPNEIARPRNRKLLSREPAFRMLRNQVLEYLLGPGSRRRRAGGVATPATEVSSSVH